MNSQSRSRRAFSVIVKFSQTLVCNSNTVAPDGEEDSELDGDERGDQAGQHRHVQVLGGLQLVAVQGRPPGPGGGGDTGLNNNVTII